MSSNKKFLLLAAAFAAVLIFAAVGYHTLSDNYEPESVPSGLSEDPSEVPAQTEEDEPVIVDAPDFTVLDHEGTSVNLSDYLGKPIVINFWATWCGPCKSELPAFDAAYATYGEDVEFLMVNLTDGSRETVDTVTSFLQETGYSFPVYFDTALSAAQTYGAYSIPLSVFIYADGTLAGGYYRAMPEATLIDAIELILAGR